MINRKQGPIVLLAFLMGCSSTLSEDEIKKTVSDSHGAFACRGGIASSLNVTAVHATKTAKEAFEIESIHTKKAVAESLFDDYFFAKVSVRGKCKVLLRPVDEPFEGTLWVILGKGSDKWIAGAASSYDQDPSE